MLIPGTRDAIFQSVADGSCRGWACLLPLKLGITREAVDFIHFVTGQDTKMKTIATEHVSVYCSGRTCTEDVQEVITIRWVWQHEWPNLFWRQVTVQFQLNSTKRWLSLKIFSSSICRLKFIQWCLHSIDVRICRFHNCVACELLCQVHLVCNSGKAKWPKERYNSGGLSMSITEAERVMWDDVVLRSPSTVVWSLFDICPKSTHKYLWEVLLFASSMAILLAKEKSAVSLVTEIKGCSAEVVLQLFCLDREV